MGEELANIKKGKDVNRAGPQIPLGEGQKF